MNRYKTLLVAAMVGLTANAQAADVSYNLGVVSLYKSNGVDQDYDSENGPFDENFRPAIQGGVDVDFGNGFYVGNWNSTGEFENADLEIDLYAGYYGEFANGVGYDLGYATYIYPDASAWNGDEVYASLNYSGFTLGFAAGVRGSTKDEGSSMARYYVSYDYTLSEQSTLTFIYGERNKAAGDFADYGVTLTANFREDLALTASYTGATDTSDAENNERDGRVVLGLTKTF